MAEPLKNSYGPDVALRIADMLTAAYAKFQRKKFLDFALNGYESLELMSRGWHLADALHHALPENYEKAIDILLASLSEERTEQQGEALASFIFMPHTFFVARYGLNHFETSMQAQYILTQRFTAEFSIRPYLQQHTKATLQTLSDWVSDPSEHVRRLVSEGTRPRLPWASRLPAFQKDPSPVLALLESLKDDTSLYVRRSVANNLNDIGKDNPDIMLDTAERWMFDASADRAWIVKHALRVAVKNVNPRALALMGHGAKADIAVESASLTPAVVKEGDVVTLRCQLRSLADCAAPPQALLVDFVVHYVKAGGHTRPKVFKLTRCRLDGDASIGLSKRISLKPMTTRQHYSGEHRVELLVNGETFPLGSFHLTL